jgi:hypothetical protein
VITEGRLTELLEDHHEAHLMRAEVSDLVAAYRRVKRLEDALHCPAHPSAGHFCRRCEATVECSEFDAADVTHSAAPQSDTSSR